ncbi:MAG: hypothetical protein ABIR30_00370 [Chitinophagaceae bacterium]
MKKIKTPGLIALVLLFNTAIAQPGAKKKGWPSTERYAFISECIKAASVGMSVDSARFYCYCMQEKVETKYPLVEDAAKLSKEDMETPEWQKKINECLGGGWTDKDRAGYLADCTAKAGKTMTGDKAKNYCECMLFKLETKYPKAADAAGLPAAYFQSAEWKKLTQSCMDF